jgi:hypothetical protein
MLLPKDERLRFAAGALLSLCICSSYLSQDPNAPMSLHWPPFILAAMGLLKRLSDVTKRSSHSNTIFESGDKRRNILPCGPQSRSLFLYFLLNCQFNQDFLKTKNKYFLKLYDICEYF